MCVARTVLLGLIATGVAAAVMPGKDAVPLFFMENRGQVHPDVKFVAKGSGVTAYFSAGQAQLRAGRASVRMQFEGANAAVRLEGTELLPGHANFLIGARENWQLDVPTYGGIRYAGLYPGIDMFYGGTGRDLKSEFRVAGGANPDRIRIRYLGAGGLRIADSGELLIELGQGEERRQLREHAPVLYQERAGGQVAVEGRFILLDEQTVGFAIGDYDRTQPLVIDPVLSYSTLLGGSGFDSATALAVDAAGSAYVAGFTDSYDLPTASPAQNYNSGGNDVFVAKLNASGNGLVYCTYVGGKGDDRAYGIAVDASGAAYVTGSTMSSNFPVRNALQSRLAGSRNAFAFKLSAAGNTLLYSTFLGGNGSDTGYGIAVDPGGSAYVAGDTTSLNFPASGLQRVFHGVQDAFVAKVSADGSRLSYSTYLGGGNLDHGSAIAVDAGGSAYVTGSTWSTDFPVASAAQGANAGGQDAFIARINAAGSALLFSTYLGGSGGTVSYPESGQGIALDGQGSAYVAGVTSSADFPTLGPLQSSRRGTTDAFVAKVSSSGVLVYGTYLGGSSVDVGNAIAVDASGSAYVAGYSYSTDLPVANALQAANAGDCDAFVAKVNAAGNSLLYLSYLGGNGSDTATAVALDPAGAVYVAGWTLSSNFPLLAPYQSTNAGNYGAFVTKVVFGQPPSNLSVSPASGSGLSQTFALQFSDPNGAADLAAVSVLFNSTLTTAAGCSIEYARAQNALRLFTDSGAAPGSNITPGSGSQQNSQCTLNGAASSVTSGGNLLTLNIAITFTASFAGAKNVYLFAQSPYGSAAWQQLGNWTVTVPPAPVLTIAKSHGGSFIQGQTGATYTVMVSNTGSGPTSGTTTVTEMLPGGLSAMSMLGSNWTCSQPSGPCSRSDALAAGASYPPITVTVNVATTATSPQINGVSVSGGGSAGGTATDPATILQPAAITSPANLATLTAASATFQWSAGSATQFMLWIGSTGAGSQELDALSGTGTSATVTNLPVDGRALYVRLWSLLNSVWQYSDYTYTAFANGPPDSNLALGKAATQSSTYATAVANLAVDGNTDGTWPAASLSHTSLETNAWWQVDLGASGTVNSVVVWNRTDCCNSRLSDYWVFASNTPFGATDTPATLQIRAGTWSSHQTAAPNPSTTIATGGVPARYVRIQLNGANFLNLAEVQVMGAGSSGNPASTNLAVGKAAAQSSTYGTSAASLAVDGSTDGTWGGASISHTNLDSNAWWQVDLGSSATVNSIVVWNRTDCCNSRLSDYWVFVSNTPFGATDTPAALQSRAGTWNSHQTTAPNPSTTIATGGVPGRYVRVQLTGTNYLNLAEVQVMGPGASGSATSSNLALARIAAQSSTYGTSFASLAVDANTDGTWAGSSISHTNLDSNAWWQVDLGGSGNVSSLVIWNRTDCCNSRLSDYWVFVSNTPFSAADTPATLQSRAGTWSSHQTTAPNPSSTISGGGAQGRYVRVQLSGANFLNLAEVQVMGTWVSGSPPPAVSN